MCHIHTHPNFAPGRIGGANNLYVHDGDHDGQELDGLHNYYDSHDFHSVELRLAIKVQYWLLARAIDSAIYAISKSCY